MLLKMPKHGSKLKKFLDVEMPLEIMEIVDDCGLLLFVDCSLTLLKASLLSAFV